MAFSQTQQVSWDIRPTPQLSKEAQGAPSWGCQGDLHLLPPPPQPRPACAGAAWGQHPPRPSFLWDTRSPSVRGSGGKSGSGSAVWPRLCPVLGGPPASGLPWLGTVNSLPAACWLSPGMARSSNGHAHSAPGSGTAPSSRSLPELGLPLQHSPPLLCGVPSAPVGEPPGSSSGVLEPLMAVPSNPRLSQGTHPGGEGLPAFLPHWAPPQLLGAPLPRVLPAPRPLCPEEVLPCHKSPFPP